MNLTPSQRAFLIRDHVIGAAIFNVLLNALLAWLTFRQHAPVSVWGNPGVAADMIATTFILPLLVGLFVPPLVLRVARAGKVEPIEWPLSAHPQLRLLPKSSWLMALTLGVGCTLLLSLPILACLHLVSAPALSLSAMVVLKALYCGSLAAAVSPVVAIHTLARASVSAPRSASN